MSDRFASNVATVDKVLAAQIKQTFGDSILNDLEPSDIGAVASTTTGITGASGVTNMVTISQANYTALPTKDANTLYVIV